MNQLRQRERLPFLIWHLGTGAESWIFLHVGNWELLADTPGTNTPTQLKPGSQNQDFMAEIVTHTNLFSKCLSVPPGRN